MKYISYAIKDSKTKIEEYAENISLKAALESIILLKNDNNTLPLNNKNIDLFGNGSRHTIKGGSGSGEVNEIGVKSIYASLIDEGFTISSKAWLDDYDLEYSKELEKYKKDIHKSIYKFDFINFMGKRINFIPGRLLNDDDIKADTCIYIISRLSGEGKDIEENEYSISDIELNNIKFCANRYKNLVLVLNIGGFFDLSFTDDISNISSIIYMGNLGRMGGKALAKILIEESPSGRLPFTYPNKYSDIPYSNEFSYNSGSLDSNYKEGIYVGYRYYDTFSKNVRYPFGYGLSYSKFSYDNFKYNTNNSIINISLDVKNIGEYKAFDTILLFLEMPKAIGENKSLVGYSKTTKLDINQKENINIEFDLFDFSYTENNKRLLRKGNYIIRYGNDVNNTYPIFKFKLDDDLVLYEVADLANSFKSELNKEIKPIDLNLEEIKLDLKYEKKNYELNNDFSILNGLSIKDKINLCVGSGLLPKTNYIYFSECAGYTTPKVKNIPSLCLSDGPAGIRVSSKVKVLRNGKTKGITPSMEVYNYLPGFFKKFKYAKDKNAYYQKTVSYPTGISLCSTFNKKLINEIGKAISLELEALGISYYLAPAINIIKNPIGGRSFEYYSEDPYLSGKTAAALINGIEESKKHCAVLKHYACNNLEFRRNEISANVSNNALRDIYLRAFEIAIKYSSASVIMSSYNKVNHKYVCNDESLLNKTLREEFGFSGMVMTDWLSTSKGYGSNSLAIKAGNDLIMPGGKLYYKEIYKAYKKGTVTEEEINRAASNVLNSIINTEMYKKYKNR